MHQERLRKNSMFGRGKKFYFFGKKFYYGVNLNENKIKFNEDLLSSMSSFLIVMMMLGIKIYNTIEFVKWKIPFIQIELQNKIKICFLLLSILFSFEVKKTQKNQNMVLKCMK